MTFVTVYDSDGLVSIYGDVVFFVIGRKGEFRARGPTLWLASIGLHASVIKGVHDAIVVRKKKP